MNYRRNEDKLCNRWPNYRQENALLSISWIEDEGVEEPVTLAEAKSHIRVDFTDDDSYITMLIKSCRAALEKFTGLSLVEKVITATINNVKGGYELPYGPVIDIMGLYDWQGEVIEASDYQIHGTDWRTVETPTHSSMKVEYLAGPSFNPIPVDLKLEILKMVAFEYENRGDSIVPYQFSHKARAHRRVPKIL